MYAQIVDGQPSRRAVLGAVAASAAAATSGCLDELNAVVRGRLRPLRVTILTPSPDIDPFAPTIARRLATALDTAGIRTSLRPASEAAFYRDVLLNGQFDIYVGRHPIGSDPVILYELFHSRFGEEIGWQNPTGLSDGILDTELARQRRDSGESRRSRTVEILERLGELSPITPVCVPSDVRIQREADDLNWGAFGIRDVRSYLGLASPNRRTVRVGVPSDGSSWNFNPLGIETATRAALTDLLYDRLAVLHDGTVHPWTAASWDRVDGAEAGESSEGTVLDIRLRSDLTWHDGRPITSADVEFTYRLLGDTVLGHSQPPSPTARHRGRSALVTETARLDDRTVRLTVDASEAVAPVALTVPVLPAHVWRSRATRGSQRGSRVPVTQVMTSRNEPPLGSGPYRYERADRSRVVLSRNRDHFLEGSPDGFAGRFVGVSRPNTLEFYALLSRDLVREFLDRGTLDAATVPVTPAERGRITGDGTVEFTERRSQTVYGIGFNTRRHPMGTPQFRQVVSRLIDRRHIVETVFGQRADPVATVGAALGVVPERLQWHDDDPPITYLGSDGRPDVDRVREAFRDAGYRYSDGGTLLVRR